MAGHQEFSDPALKMAVRIPSPPPLGELDSLLGDPDARMEDTSQVVQTEVCLATSLYRTLAKPIYGLRRPPETVAQAISPVGLRTVSEPVKGRSIESAVYGDSRFYPWFWARASEIAGVAADGAAEFEEGVLDQTREGG